MEDNAIAAGTLQSVKGLGRHWTWRELIQLEPQKREQLLSKRRKWHVPASMERMTSMKHIPPELDRMAEVVLAYRPPEKVKATKRRAKRKAQRVAKKR